MTDNEIIKVLECCMQTENISCCAKCSLRDKDYCYSEVSKNALDLINRQRAELEELKEDYIPKLEWGLKRANEIGMSQDAEIERIKTYLKYYLETNEEKGVVYIPKFAIDNLIKEMKEVQCGEIVKGRGIMSEYIDKNQLIQRIKQEPTDGMYTEEILSAIDEIEAADVAEVRHGKWVRMEDDVVYWYACSECKKRIPKTEYGNDAWSNYCPNCGAKMDLGDDEE